MIGVPCLNNALSRGICTWISRVSSCANSISPLICCLSHVYMAVIYYHTEAYPINIQIVNQKYPYL